MERAKAPFEVCGGREFMVRSVWSKTLRLGSVGEVSFDGKGNPCIGPAICYEIWSKLSKIEDGLISRKLSLLAFFGSTLLDTNRLFVAGKVGCPMQLLSLVAPRLPHARQ